MRNRHKQGVVSIMGDKNKFLVGSMRVCVREGGRYECKWTEWRKLAPDYTETLSYATPLTYPPFNDDLTLIKNWSLFLRRSSAASIGYKIRIRNWSDCCVDVGTCLCSMDHLRWVPRRGIAGQPWRNWGSERVSSPLGECSGRRFLLDRRSDGRSRLYLILWSVNYKALFLTFCVHLTLGGSWG